MNDIISRLRDTAFQAGLIGFGVCDVEPFFEVATEMGPRLAGRTSLTALRALQALARVVLALVIVPLRATVGGDE